MITSLCRVDVLMARKGQTSGPFYLPICAINFYLPAKLNFEDIGGCLRSLVRLIRGVSAVVLFLAAFCGIWWAIIAGVHWMWKHS
jgi:hypothetical protein